jgi:uncharacterized repeat protein (TIGR04138 family)
MAQRLRESIEELVQRDGRFPADAYLLVFEGLEAALASLAARRHVSPGELARGVYDAAVDQWGLLACDVLEEWNVTCGADIGDMVFNLVDRRLLVASEHDTRTEFAGIGDLRAELFEAFERSLDRDPPTLKVS